MTKAKPTLIFIPDISGFTDFVNKTEINHSRHIISELLELIINSDKLDLTVSEIEGDAVLFFKEEVPSVDELVKQCEQTFINFHSHLRRYDTERICRCGACKTASQLSLKFIIHKGGIEKINVKGHQKLHGSDVILAHKLMKNSIPENEYILISNQFEDELGKINFGDELSVKKQHDKYQDLGEISYSFIGIKHLMNKLVEAPSLTFPGLSPDKIYMENTINAPIDLIYENFTNFEKRVEWNEEIREIILQDDKLNKSGSMHTCLVGQYSLDIETLGRLEDDDKIVYGERLNKFKSLRDIITIYTFEKKGGQTEIKTEIDYKIKSWFGKLLKPMIRKMLYKQTETGLKKLKQISEQHAD